MADYLRLIAAGTHGPRCDVTPLFEDRAVFADLIEDMAAPFAGADVDTVAGIDALGFILGAAMALRLGTGFTPVRKGGKLPVAADRLDFVDYTGQAKSLDLRVGAVHPGLRVLVVDEWIETAAQVTAAVRLIENQGGLIIGIAAINIDDNAATRQLRDQYRCHALRLE